MGREATPEAQRLSANLRRSRARFVSHRRRLTALSLGAIGSLGVVTLYQMGAIKRVPEPRLPFLDADRVDASPEAYASLSMPDAALGIASYAVTLALATMGDGDRAINRPWIPVALAAKVAVDAVAAGWLTLEQGSKHRAFCSWCLVAAFASFTAVPYAIPEARLAARQLLASS